MIGQIVESDITNEERNSIQDEFEEGKMCYDLYEKVYKAKKELCQQLGKEEVIEVEIIIHNMLEIAEILALKMYEYGKEDNRTA